MWQTNQEQFVIKKVGKFLTVFPQISRNQLQNDDEIFSQQSNMAIGNNLHMVKIKLHNHEG